MKSTVTLAGNLNTNPFEIFAQDVDEVIMLINFYLTIGHTPKESPKQGGTKQRVKVNDNTASGGWW